MIASGNLRKMLTELDSSVHYKLPIGEERVALNPLIGTHIALEFTGVINCVHCSGKQTRASIKGIAFLALKN